MEDKHEHEHEKDPAEETMDKRPTCYFHFVMGVRVVLRDDGECPLCVDAPDDDNPQEALDAGPYNEDPNRKYRRYSDDDDDTDDDEGCWFD
ncbi:hypothetical protein [Streptomyces chartreusis]|uniref:hypothetical protein n=1 Tax=Streptomyces chartreusis TaxID=1969 RepID=UPI0033CED747